MKNLVQAKMDLFKKMSDNALAAIPEARRKIEDSAYRNYIVATERCSYRADSRGSCRGVVTTQARLPEFHLGEGRKVQACLPAYMNTGGFPASFKVRTDKPSDIGWGNSPLFYGCCANVEADKGDTDQQVISKLREKVAMDFIHKRILAGLAFAAEKGISTPTAKLATVLQAYNGYGLAGAEDGESLESNPCLAGLQTKVAPIYGAGSADLLLNGIMANPSIRDLVAQASGGNSVSSAVCEILGSGSYNFEATDFTKLQQNYLSGRKCPEHSYSYKPSKPSSSLSGSDR